MKLVERAVKSCREFIEKNNPRGFSGIKLIIREIMINAVEHGNKNIAALSIQCLIEQSSARRFKITVTDEGEGFDYRNVNLAIPEDPLKIRNRGLPLVNALADSMEFNEKGNEISAYFTIETGTEFIIEKTGDINIIMPTGDITAAYADTLRTSLQALIEKKDTMFRFDMINVNDIDSVGLSVFIVLSRTLSRKTETSHLEFVNLSPDIKRLFEVMRMDTLYKINEKGINV